MLCERQPEKGEVDGCTVGERSSFSSETPTSSSHSTPRRSSKGCCLKIALRMFHLISLRFFLFFNVQLILSGSLNIIILFNRFMWSELFPNTQPLNLHLSVSQTTPYKHS